MRKLILLFALVLAMTAHAYDFSVSSRGIPLYYSINPDGETVSVTFGPEPYSNPIIEIPQTVEDSSGKNYTVTAIGEKSFYLCEVRNVTLPASIDVIGVNAFSWSSLETINFPDCLEEIGEEAFKECPLKELTFPSSLHSIGGWAFNDCGFITEIYLPDSLTFLGECAFKGCWSLQKVSLPSSLLKIEDGVFAGCESLTEVVFKDGLEEIGNMTFSGCPLEKFTFPQTLKKIGEENFDTITFEEFTIPDHIIEIEAGLCNNNENLKKIVFGKGLTAIPANVCAACPNLTEVEIPDNITSIDNGAFRKCQRLSHIKIPDNITGLPDECFRECISLTHVELPSNLQAIRERCFLGCSSLKEIVLPLTLKDIGGEAFRGCNGLVVLNIPLSVKLVGQRAFYGVRGNIHMEGGIPPIVYDPIYVDPTEPVNDNKATLYVPKGAIDGYKDVIVENRQLPLWDCFKEMIEEEVPNTIFGITSRSASCAKIFINGKEQDIWGDTYEIESGSSATITIELEEGYILRYAKINGTDITSGIEAGQYTIDCVTTNYILDLSFIDFDWSLYQNYEGTWNYIGRIDVKPEQGENFRCRIIPNEGWKIRAVYYSSDHGYNDVTDQVDEDGAYSSDDRYLCNLLVCYEAINPDLNPEEMNHKLRVYPSNDCSIAIEGAATLDISIANIENQIISQMKADSNYEIVNVPGHGDYLITIGKRIFKVKI